jgi:5'-nucleotidase
VSLRILVTNDDGIYAPGLWALVEELKRTAEVIVVAPDREQSATGTSVTLSRPLRVNRIRPLLEGVEAYSVEGTPADSVILALGTLIEDGVDMVLSGINEGANLGSDVFISGTVGAAFQGHLRGLPAIALSVAALGDIHLGTAARLAALLAGKMPAKTLPPDILLNVNVPNLPPDEIKGIEVTRLAPRSYTNAVEEGHDGKRKCYRIVRGQPQQNMDKGTDVWAVSSDFISILPLGGDLSTTPAPSSLKDLCSQLLDELRSKR